MTEYVIEFRSGSFFVKLEADFGGPLEDAKRFGTHEEADTFMDQHEWIVFNGGMVKEVPRLVARDLTGLLLAEVLRGKDEIIRQRALHEAKFMDLYHRIGRLLPLYLESPDKAVAEIILLCDIEADLTGDCKATSDISELLDPDAKAFESSLELERPDGAVLRIGARVRTISSLEIPADRSIVRRAGENGIVVELFCDGSLIKVRHPDGALGAYDPSELIVVSIDGVAELTPVRD